MSDLRTRIIKACHDADTNSLATREDWYIVADAVIRELLPTREGAWGWLDGTVSTNPQTGNPIKLEIEPGEVIPLSVEDARSVALALLAAVAECEDDPTIICEKCETSGSVSTYERGGACPNCGSRSNA